METRVQKLEDKMGELDRTVSVFGEIIKRFDSTINRLAGSLEKFDVAVDDLKISMMTMKQEVENNCADLKTLKAKVETLDEKSKWDWQNFVTSKVIPFLVGGGAIYAITEIFKK